MQFDEMGIREFDMRKGPGTKYISNGFIPVGICTIVVEKDGWGFLKAYSEKRNGWVCLEYTERV